MRFIRKDIVFTLSVSFFSVLAVCPAFAGPPPPVHSGSCAGEATPADCAAKYGVIVSLKAGLQFTFNCFSGENDKAFICISQGNGTPSLTCSPGGGLISASWPYAGGMSSNEVCYGVVSMNETATNPNLSGF